MRKIVMIVCLSMLIFSSMVMAAPVKLSFWHMETMEPRKSTLETMVNEFNRLYPEIEIEAMGIDPSIYMQKIQTAMAGAQEPDLFMFWGGGKLKPYVEAGKIAKITEDFASDYNWKSRFLPGVLGVYTFNQEIYAVPGEFQSIVMYYNKEIFKQAGLTVPKTMADLEEAIKVLKGQQVIPIAYPGKESWIGEYYYDYLTIRLAGPELFANIINGESNFSQDVFIEAGNKIVDLINLGAFPPGYQGVDYMTAQTLFVTGKAAMYLQGSWAIGEFMDKERMPEGFTQRVGLMNFPVFAEGKGDPTTLIGGAGMGYVMTEKCSNKSAGLKFMKWITEKPQAIFKSESVGFLTGVDIKLDPNKVSPLLLDFSEMVSGAARISPYFENVFSPAVKNAHLNAVGKIFAKSARPEEAVKLINKALAEEF